MATTGAESYAAFHSPAARSTVAPSRHSEVAYLFGGIASMVGLIGLAILILACAYWNLSGHFQDGGEDIDEELGEKKKNEMNCSRFQGEKILVIMAGEEKPTFIATPTPSTVTSRASSFASSQAGSTAAADQDKSSSHDDDIGDDQVITPLEGTGTHAAIGDHHQIHHP